MNLKIRKSLQMGALFLILVTSYTNCSKGLLSDEEGEGSSESATSAPSSGEGICEDSLMGLFGRGYYKFARANCISCHATDSDKPQFASPDMNWAYKVFNDKGYTKVSDNAINANHQAGYSGPQHIQAINELRLEWQQGLKEYSQCKGIANIGETVDPATLLSLETISTQLPAMAIDEEKIVTWDLNKDILQKKATGIIPVLPGAKLSIVVVRRETGGGEEFFEVRKPLIVGSTVDIRLKTMYVQVNGRPLKYPTTFKFIDRSIRKGSTDEKTGLISTGYLVVLGKYSPLDTISLAFEKLEAIDMPAAQTPPIANLLGPKVLVIDSSSGSVNIEVELSKAFPEVVAMSLQNDNQALCGSTGDAAISIGPNCLPDVYAEMQRQGLTSVSDLTVRPARSIVGNSFNRWDWDYENKINSFLIGGAITRKSFEILFSKITCITYILSLFDLLYFIEYLSKLMTSRNYFVFCSFIQNY